MVVGSIGVVLVGGALAIWYGLTVARRRVGLGARLGGSLLASAGVAIVYFGIALIRALLKT
jgi:hypothetical protein